MLGKCQASSALQRWVHEPSGALHLQSQDKGMCVAVKNFLGPQAVMWPCSDLKENARFSFNSTDHSMCTPGATGIAGRCLVADAATQPAEPPPIGSTRAGSAAVSTDCACCCCGSYCADVCQFCADAMQLWAKPQPDGAVAVLVVNSAGKENLSATIDFAEVHYEPGENPTRVFDVWAQAELPTLRGATAFETPLIGPGDSVYYTFTPGRVARRPVERHIGRWNRPPLYVPTRVPTDGPLAGNGDFGVVVGGGRQCTLDGGCAIAGGANVSDADIGFWFGKSDFWINQPVVSADQTGEPWSHATPGFLAVSVDAGGPIPAFSRSFEATQELSNGRLNATTAVAAGTTLASSTFVASDRNLLISRLRIEGDSNNTMGVTFTLSTPNFWQIPVRSGATQDQMWLRKDACNHVRNALTLTPCSPDVLLYNSLRAVHVGDNSSFHFLNGTEMKCVELMPPAGSIHTANGALSPGDAWLSASPCADRKHPTWQLIKGKLTDGERCAAYSTTGNQWNVKVVSHSCSVSPPAGLSDEWILEGSGNNHSRLRAVNANLTGDPRDGDVLYDGGAYLLRNRSISYSFLSLTLQLANNSSADI